MARAPRTFVDGWFPTLIGVALIGWALCLPGCTGEDPISSASSGLRPVDEPSDPPTTEPGDATPKSGEDSNTDTGKLQEDNSPEEGNGQSGSASDPTNDELLKIPDGGAAELTAHLEKLNARLRKLAPAMQNRQLPAAARDALVAEMTPILNARLATAEKLLVAEDAEVEDRMAAVQMKLDSLGFLAAVGEPGAEESIVAFAQSLTKDESPQLRKVGVTISLSMEAEQFGRDGKDNPSKLIEHLAALLAIEPEKLSRDDFMIARDAAMALFRAEQVADGVRVLRIMGGGFAKSEDPEMEGVAASMLEQADEIELSDGFRQLTEGDVDEQAASKFLASAKGVLQRDELQMRSLLITSQMVGDLKEKHGETAEQLRQLVAAGVARLASEESSVDQLSELILSASELGDEFAEPLAKVPDVLVAKIEQQMSRETVSLEDYQDAMQIAERGFESNGQAELAARIYDLLAGAVTKLDDKDRIEAQQEQIAAAQKRVGLIGKPLTVEGSLLDGKPLDWSAYKGKVVLVDFWATWCGPCLAEIPNIYANYDKYHDQGFEVIGVNIDEDPAEITTLFENRGELPWKTVISEDPERIGPQSPMAQKCGVVGIPFVVLIGRDGNVLDIHVRGPKLGERLAELFPEEKPETPADGEKE